MLSFPLGAQLLPPPPPDYKPPAPPTYEEPPEEDESLSTSKVYTFNPLQAKKEIEVGNMHMTRGNYKGAVYRFREATLWDDGNVDAYYKLGEANEKLKDYPSAREAFTKYAEMVGDRKKVADVQKRIAKYPEKPPEAVKKDPEINTRNAPAPLIYGTPPPGSRVPGQQYPYPGQQYPGQYPPGTIPPSTIPSTQR